MSGWRSALRLARRETRRARGRSALVVAMIGLPVAALAFAAAGYDTFTLTPGERADRQMGTAQAVVAWPYDRAAHQFPDWLDAFPADFGAATPDEATARPTVERLLALLPSGTKAVAAESGRLNVRTATGTAGIGARMLDYRDPLARGIYRPLSGRAPAATDEVALTRGAARRLGAGVGGTVRLTDGTRAFRVVGLVEDPSDLSAITIVLRPGAFPAGTLSTNRRDQTWLVATPGPLVWADVRTLNTHGVVAVSRHVLAHPPDPAELGFDAGDRGRGSALAIMVLVGGLAMLEIVLLAGPAFAVGARRRQRDLALAAAVGAAPAHLRRIVLADGVVLGALAAVAGVFVGIAAAVATHSWFERIGDARSGAFRVFPVALAVLAGLAVVTGVLAALVPAWVSARQDVVPALAGRRGITRSRRRWPILGAVLVAAGAVAAGAGAWRVDAVVILTGLVVVELGLILATPAVVGLVARTGRWLPLAPRLALRDIARNRTAAAPAISAVMAAVVGSLAAGVVLGAVFLRETDSRRSALSRPGDVVLFPGGGKVDRQQITPETIGTLRETLPVTQVYEIGMPSCESSFCAVRVQTPPAYACPYAPETRNTRGTLTRAQQRAARDDRRCDGVGREHAYFGGFSSNAGMTVVIDDSAAGAVANLPADDVAPVTAALRAGKVVVSDSRDLVDGQVTLTITAFRPEGPGATRTVTAPAVALPHPPGAPITLMTRATARSLGLDTEQFLVLATTSRMPTVAEQDRAEAAYNGSYYVYVERPEAPDAVFLTVLAILAGVVTLGAAAIATGLAAADGRTDLVTLGAVGASPRVRRALSLSQAGVIAGLGSFLGVLAGLGASTAVLFALNQRYADVWPEPLPYPVRVPWWNVGVALVVVPVIAMLGAGLLTRSRLPIERRL